MAINNSVGSASMVGQRALVTGGNGGIGAAVSQALAAAGVQVAINYVGNADSAEQLVADTDIPALAVLLNEAGKAEYLMGQHHALAA